ncbi:metallophosphoesterase [Alloscardovia criceti]|uniref:metallophosphoesterase n=1 Tax=Alloscardovia criceti TaxID=356828 RepID=UPI001FE02D14|nr:metallophosphoesterase [Alloscardovia criceti]
MTEHTSEHSDTQSSELSLHNTLEDTLETARKDMHKMEKAVGKTLHEAQVRSRTSEHVSARSRGASSTSVSARLGQLQFHASGKFRVLQVSDIQTGPKVSKDTVRLIAAACDAARPDIVIFTGNQIAGYDSAYTSTFVKRRWTPKRTTVSPEDKEATKQLVRGSLAQFLKPLVDRAIPFAVTFGNHDFQCGLSLEEMVELYREFPGCTNPTAASAQAVELLANQKIYASSEPGTFALPVRDQYNEKNLIGLTLVNSGDYAPEGGYASPSVVAMKFLKTAARDMNVRAMAFQHMPVHKFYQLLTAVPATTVNAIQGYRSFENQSFVLDETKTYAGSYLGEGISCPDKDSGEFRCLQDHNYFALAAGHDHRNALAGVVEGMVLASTPTAGFNTYGPAPERRGVRLFEFDIRHPYEPRTQLLEFGELVGKPSGNKAYALASTYIPNNTGEAINLLRKPKVLASVAAVLAGMVSLFTFWRKRK